MTEEALELGLSDSVASFCRVSLSATPVSDDPNCYPATCCAISTNSFNTLPSTSSYVPAPYKVFGCLDRSI